MSEQSKPSRVVSLTDRRAGASPAEVRDGLRRLAALTTRAKAA